MTANKLAEKYLKEAEEYSREDHVMDCAREFLEQKMREIEGKANGTENR